MSGHESAPPQSVASPGHPTRRIPQGRIAREQGQKGVLDMKDQSLAKSNMQSAGRMYVCLSVQLLREVRGEREAHGERPQVGDTDRHTRGASRSCHSSNPSKVGSA